VESIPDVLLEAIRLVRITDLRASHRADSAMRSLLGATAWSALGRADLGTADAVPDALFRLCRGRSPEVRTKALSDLYCPLSNQGTAGEASPAAVQVLVTALREGWCRDHEPVYDVLQEIGRTTVVLRGDLQEQVLSGIRSALSAGLDVYLADLDRGSAAESFLFELLILLAPRHEVIVERLRAVGEPAAEALRDALEHIDEHMADPGHC
jgi:hypothetical protein